MHVLSYLDQVLLADARDAPAVNFEMRVSVVGGTHREIGGMQVLVTDSSVSSGRKPQGTCLPAATREAQRFVDWYKNFCALWSADRADCH